ncbi:M4 family metallopeptidase [Kitasatospora sp. NPDC058170]|uniref:M4 family metallopeptidase n=1 Tax=Kitasatospora sp. NPDC058170 TaxID=3346364 RepID=UPI0036DC684B
MHHRSRTPRALGVGITAALSLVLAASPALAGPAVDPDPVPGLVAGEGTATPQLVTGLSDAAPGNPADAARAYLAAHSDRYKIDPGQLAEIGTERAADGRRTVRFEQRHGGLPVLGAQYLVHLVGDGAEQRVESVGGKYFTGLTAPTTPAVPAPILRERALDAVKDPRARAGAAVEDHGLVVLPGGAGRLAQHFTLRGSDPATGDRVVREVYVDATVGVVALAHDARAPYSVGGGSAAGAAAGAKAGARAAGSPAARAEADTDGRGGAVAGAAAGVEPATGTAPDLSGRSVKVNIGRLPDGSYQLTDLTRSAAITTYDGAGRDSDDFRGGIPADSAPAHSAGPDFPASTGTSGATDAHVNAGTVYDFYRNRLGREGLDGKGGPITSVVNVTAGGQSLPNAYWDGSKMVYGSGDAKYRQFAVALDVAGHEMTHGVIDHTAKLAYVGQSGAMNEALADYFGNAIEVTARGQSMNDPKAALLGESLCRTGTPEACASRRLDDHRTTVTDYVGAGISVDNGGVHLNSTIFGGALWDIRRTLDPLTADRLVYRALTEYLTPLDDFVDGRNAVLTAGRALNLNRAQLRAVEKAFDAHGIRAGWQSRLGLDSRPLLRDISTSMAAPAAANGRWVMMSNTETLSKTALFTGATNGSGTPTRLSPEDGRYHGWAATDGKSAAWVAIGPDAQGVFGMELLTSPLSGGPVRSLYRSANQQPGELGVSGNELVFRTTDYTTDRTTIHLYRDGTQAAEIPLPAGHSAGSLTFKDGTIAWSEQWAVGEDFVLAPTVYSIAAGKVTAQYLNSVGPGGTDTLLAGGRLLWRETPIDGSKPSSIRSGALDGSGVTDVLPADSPAAVRGLSFTASDQAVTFEQPGSKPSSGWTNAALPKLWQLPITGGTPQRLSCNRGSQIYAAADQGTRVVWLDATAGRTDLVVRDRPAGSC